MWAISPTTIWVLASYIGELQPGNAHWLPDSANSALTVLVLGETVLYVRGRDSVWLRELIRTNAELGDLLLAELDAGRITVRSGRLRRASTIAFKQADVSLDVEHLLARFDLLTAVRDILTMHVDPPAPVARLHGPLMRLFAGSEPCVLCGTRRPRWWRALVSPQGCSACGSIYCTHCLRRLEPTHRGDENVGLLRCASCGEGIAEPGALRGGAEWAGWTDFGGTD